MLQSMLQCAFHICDYEVFFWCISYNNLCSVKTGSFHGESLNSPQIPEKLSAWMSYTQDYLSQTLAAYTLFTYTHTHMFTHTHYMHWRSQVLCAHTTGCVCVRVCCACVRACVLACVVCVFVVWVSVSVYVHVCIYNFAPCASSSTMWRWWLSWKLPASAISEGCEEAFCIMFFSSLTCCTWRSV